MKWKEPTTIEELEKELLIHAKDGRSDALFRHAIAIDQIGSLVRYITHDTNENPSARPHGTPDGEIEAAGHAMVQLMTYCALRKINLQDAISMALGNLREKDFIKREPIKSNDGYIHGITAMNGVVRGKAWVCLNKLNQMPQNPKDWILVIPHAESDSRITKFAGVVTEHGGMFCHAAIIAREKDIPCIVGTGNITKLIHRCQVIELNALMEQAYVKVI